MKKIILFICLLAGTTVLFAQDLQKTDLRQIHVDQLSDEEITYYYNKLQQSNVSLDQAFQIAAARGMPQDEIEKLRQRIQLIKTNPKVTTPPSSNSPNDNNLPSDSAKNGRTETNQYSKHRRKKLT